MYGRQCPKKLWQTVHDPEPVEEALAGTVKGTGIEVRVKAPAVAGRSPGRHKIRRLLWGHRLRHAAYPIFSGVTQARNLINMRPERTWDEAAVIRYRNRRTLLKTIVRPFLRANGTL